MNKINAQVHNIKAPTNTSAGKNRSKSLPKIIGINKIAPAGGKYIFVLSKAKNSTIHASAVHIKSGSPKTSFNNNLNEQPINDANVIKPTM